LDTRVIDLLHGYSSYCICIQGVTGNIVAIITVIYCSRFSIISRWQFGLVVTSLSVSTKLLYV